MKATLHELRFDGCILRRGFWLYVWEIKTLQGPALYYIGRTGDSSSTNAQSPFNRMGQHLGFAKNSNMLRRHLNKYGIKPEGCIFRLIALGPIEAESDAATRLEHDERRDVVAALEKALADALRTAGYGVMNTVQCRKPLDVQLFAEIRASFATCFPGLRKRKTVS